MCLGVGYIFALKLRFGLDSYSWSYFLYACVYCLYRYIVTTMYWRYEDRCLTEQGDISINIIF